MSSGGEIIRMWGLAAFCRCGIAHLENEGTARIDLLHQVGAMSVAAAGVSG
jgi:hypothetical protein